MTNGPDLLDVWEECTWCCGEGTVLDGQFDITCPECEGDGGWERRS